MKKTLIINSTVPANTKKLNLAKLSGAKICEGCTKSNRSKEFCCKACGSPFYPDCKESCKLFDD